MNFNFSNIISNISLESNNNIISKFIKELEEGLNIMNNKEYTIDRIEDNIVVLEDRDTKEMIDMKKEELPKNIKEGSILIKKDGKYILDIEK